MLQGICVGACPRHSSPNNADNKRPRTVMVKLEGESVAVAHDAPLMRLVLGRSRSSAVWPDCRTAPWKSCVAREQMAIAASGLAARSRHDSQLRVYVGDATNVGDKRRDFIYTLRTFQRTVQGDGAVARRHVGIGKTLVDA